MDLKIIINIKKMKAFREQFKECTKDGTAYEDTIISICELKIIACKKYGGQCRSDKCKKERLLT